MSSQLQLVIYEGYLADDPTMRFTPQGRAVTNFRIGSNREYKNAEGAKVKETTWLKISAWGKLAEIVNQYCEKGSHVIVTGTLRIGKNGSPTVFQMKNEEWAASYELNAEKVRIIKGKDNVSGEHVGDGADDFQSSDDEIPY